jgi:hypothetical protein
MDTLDQVKDGNTIPDWREDRVAVWGKDDVALAVDRSAQVMEREIGLHLATLLLSEGVNRFKRASK